MLTRDRKGWLTRSATLGIDEVRAELQPQDMLAAIAEARLTAGFLPPVAGALLQDVIDVAATAIKTRKRLFQISRSKKSCTFGSDEAGA